MDKEKSDTTLVTLEFDQRKLFDMLVKVNDGGYSLGVRLAGALLMGGNLDVLDAVGLSIYGISAHSPKGHISLGGCSGAELPERLGSWCNEIKRIAKVYLSMGDAIAAGGNERLAEDLQRARALIEQQAEALEAADKIATAWVNGSPDEINEATNNYRTVRDGL